MLKYWWLFPFISGLLAFTGVLTPIANIYIYWGIWSWGLIVLRELGTQVEFIDDPVILIIGICVALLILVCSMILIFTGYSYRRRKFVNKRMGRLWIWCGVFILVSTIIMLISLDYYTYDGYLPYGIWSIFNPGFGAIGPIMGGVLAIGMGWFLTYSETGRKYRREKVVRLLDVTPKRSCPFCGKKISLHASFCSKCGRSIE